MVDSSSYHRHHQHSRPHQKIRLTDIIIRKKNVQECLLLHLDDNSLSILRKTARIFKYFGRVPPLVNMVYRYVPIQSALLANMDIVDIIALSRTTKAFADLYQAVVRTQYNVDRDLAPFFSVPREFRNVQVKTDAIISGHFAIDFFDRRNPVRDEAVLQIQVEKGTWLDIMLTYLRNDGWNEAHDTDPENNAISDGFYRSMRFFKVGSESKSKERDDPEYRVLEIEVLVAMRCPLFTMLDYAICTHGLTFMTWSHAYCLLPLLTFHSRQFHILQPALVQYNRTSISRILRNSQRDFDMEATPIDIRDIQRENVVVDKSHIENSKPSRVDLGPRRVGDKHTWSIPLRTQGIEPSTSPSILTTHAMFRMLPVPHPDPEDILQNSIYPIAHYKVHVELVNAPCLKHRYITCPCAMTKIAPHVCMKRYIDISHIQLESMAIEDRPPGYTAMRTTELEFRWSDLQSEYTPPKYWKYYDEEIQHVLLERWGMRSGRFGDAQ